MARDKLSEAEMFVVSDHGGCGYLEGHKDSWSHARKLTSKGKHDCLLLKSSAISLLYDILFPTIILALRIRLNSMIIIC